MTVYFPLVVHGAMLVEPTETESKAALDQFIGALRSIALRAKNGDPALKTAPPRMISRQPSGWNASRFSPSGSNMASSAASSRTATALAMIEPADAPDSTRGNSLFRSEEQTSELPSLMRTS